MEIKQLISELKKVNPFVEGNIFKSVENVNLSTIIAYKQNGQVHHFLDTYNDKKGIGGSMAYKIICYGDSILMVPAVFVGGRHHADIRWTGILQNSGLYDVVNLGENGREIPSDQWELNRIDGDSAPGG